MFSRIFWSLVLVSTLYVLWVFFFPKETDEVADALGIQKVNPAIRSMGSFFSNDLGNYVVQPMNDGSGLIRQAQDVVDKTKSGIDTTKEVVGQKAEQAQKVVDSINKASNAIGELKQNVSDFTSVPAVGSGASWSWNSSASGSSGTGKTTN